MKVQCPQCDAAISVDAVYAGRSIKCPKCNWRFLANGKNSSSGNPDSAPSVVMIEQTSKKYKGRQLIGVAIIIVGIFFMAIGVGCEKIAAYVIAGLFFSTGFGIYTIARIQAWWYHG
jgi:predicted Zn finger-like uncharacterized protein